MSHHTTICPRRVSDDAWTYLNSVLLQPTRPSIKVFDTFQESRLAQLERKVNELVENQEKFLTSVRATRSSHQIPTTDCERILVGTPLFTPQQTFSM